MKTALAALLTLVTSVAFAAPNSDAVKATLESQTQCGSFVRFDDANVYLGFGRYKNGVEEPRAAIPGVLRVAPIGQKTQFDLQTPDAPVDIVTVGTTAYVLTYSDLEEWDLNAKKMIASYQTQRESGALEYRQHATGMARYKNLLVISHGRLGVTFFDLNTKTLAGEARLALKQAPLESQATGIAIAGNVAYITMDGFSLVEPGTPIFQGLILVNLDNGHVMELGGMDPGATAITTDGTHAVVSFGGDPLWKFTLSSLNTGHAEPDARVFKFPMQGHPSGSPAMDSKYLYTCYSVPPSGGKSGLASHVPHALDLSVLK